MRSLLLSAAAPRALFAADPGGGGGGGGGDPWFAAPTLGLDVKGADKDIATYLTETKAPDLKTALRSSIGATKPPAGWDKVGMKPAAGFFDLDAEGADKDIAEHIAGKRYPDLKAALRSGMSAEKLARDRKALAAPEKGKEAEWEGWEQLGWEKDKGKYKVPALDPAKVKLPPGMTYDQADEDELVAFAHENRIPLKTAIAARDMLVNQQIKGFDKLRAKGAKAIEVTEESLAKDWGVDSQRNKEIAKRAMQAGGVGADDAAQLEKLMGAPAMVKMFHQFGSLIGEQSLPALGTAGTGMPTSVAGIDSELARLQTDKEFMAAFRDERHARHGDVVAQRQRLINEKARLQSGEKR